MLSRFRPAGAPGAATPAGVPADRRATAAAELEPVFAALAATVAEAEKLHRDAAAAAARDSAAAAERAQALVARARIDGQAQREAEAAALRQRSAAEARQVTEQAQRDADAVSRRAAQRRPELVDRVLDRVRADLSAIGGQVGDPT